MKHPTKPLLYATFIALFSVVVIALFLTVESLTWRSGKITVYNQYGTVQWTFAGTIRDNHDGSYTVRESGSTYRFQSMIVEYENAK